MWGTRQNLGQIGSAVFTFIGYKQTKTPRQAKYIYRCEGLTAVEMCKSLFYRNHDWKKSVFKILNIDI